VVCAEEQSFSPTFLIVEDDPDDRLFLQIAAEKSKLAESIVFFNSGSELVDFLTRNERGFYSHANSRRYVILLDAFPAASTINDLVQNIRSVDHGLGNIPILALITSEAEKDYLNLHDLSLFGYLIKPVTDSELSGILNGLDNEK
jgi:CheY-like chemotaxis protein